MSRRLPGALIQEPERMVARAVRLVRDGTVTAIDGEPLELAADTICVHGDTPGALGLVRTLRNGLEAAGISVEPLRAESTS